MTDAAPVVVLAAPGGGGAQLAAALADASGRPVAAWDEVADEPIGAGQLVRSACREVLWRRERDWTCPPPTFEVDDSDRALTIGWLELLTSDPAPVVHDVTLPFLLPLLFDVCDELMLVVAARDLGEALPHLLSGQELEPGAADDLIRAANHRLAAMAAIAGVSVVGVTGDLDLSAVAAEVMQVDPGHSQAVLSVTVDGGTEVDAAVEQMWGLADARPPQLVGRGPLSAAIDLEAAALDRHRGPRTAARRSLFHHMAARSGPRGEVMECSRAMGAGAVAVGGHEALITYVDGLPTLRRAVTVAPASIARLLLTDVTSWLPVEELPAVLELAMGVVRYGGTVLVGRNAADDEMRQLLGLPPIDDEAIVASARELGLVPLPAAEAGGVRSLLFAAHTAIAGTVSDLEAQVARLEEHLGRRTEQRDAALARYEALRDRRAVRIVLGVAEAFGDAARHVRGVVDG